VTRGDPPAHRMALLQGGSEEVLALARRPFRPRPTGVEVATALHPASEEVRELQATVQKKKVRLTVLANRWDRLRIQGRAAGRPKQDLLREITRERRSLGRTHLSLSRLLEGLAPGPWRACSPGAPSTRAAPGSPTSSRWRRRSARGALPPPPARSRSSEPASRATSRTTAPSSSTHPTRT